MEPQPEDVISSPCVSVCTIDPETKQCIGCLRTLKEIGGWRVMSTAEKKAVIVACEERAKVQTPLGKDRKPLVR